MAAKMKTTNKPARPSAATPKNRTGVKVPKASGSPRRIAKVAAVVELPEKRKHTVHYTAGYLINPAHPVTVNVIGTGGTGSQVLNSLARMHSALKALGHTGLYVRAVDPDRVTEANMGRQLFSPADVDRYKCVVLIGRINRFFGTDWEGVPDMYNEKTQVPTANITISCVDTASARKGIKQTLLKAAETKNPRELRRVTNFAYLPHVEPYHVPYYWLDFGNMMDRGQAVLGTVQAITQPEKSEHECVGTLPTVDELHPDIFKDVKGEDQGPSCSLAEALGKQDLFINTNLANMGLGLLWKLFREAHLRYHGLYLNLDTMSVNAIKIRK
jgi:PRTRC genetic system ThiF family protein